MLLAQALQAVVGISRTDIKRYIDNHFPGVSMVLVQIMGDLEDSLARLETSDSITVCVT